MFTLKQGYMVLFILILLGSIGIVSALRIGIGEAIAVENGDPMVYTFHPVADATIKHQYPNSTYGSMNKLLVSPEVYTYPARTFGMDILLRCDLSQLPSNSQVLSATLRLYYLGYDVADPAHRELSLFSIMEDWNEQNVTWANQPLLDTTKLSVTTVPNISRQWLEWDVTSNVQNIVNHQQDNCGWAIRDDELYHINMYSAIAQFRSKDGEQNVPELLVVINNNKPSPPAIYGPSTGSVGMRYEYIFVPEDPDGEDMHLWVEWGGSCPNKEWIGPFASGNEIVIANIWNGTGDYVIRAKAKDMNGLEGDWGTLEISMPLRHRTLLERIVEWLVATLSTIDVV